MESLEASFRCLETAVQQRQSQPDAERLLDKVGKATQRCLDVIEELQTECEKFRAEPNLCLKSRIQFAGRRVSYPFRKSTLQKIEEDASHIRDSVSFALDILQLKSNNRIEDGVSAVRSLLERTHSRQTSFAIRTWLQAPDASVNHNAVYPKHHPDTGLWLTDGPQFAN
ncbi:unnamed protein product [Penicillium olsonii]|nr:unnamed protein product [Penicillium olsonii]CAG7929089.1 unnamed protein product [Penicillium olsonii]